MTSDEYIIKTHETVRKLEKIAINSVWEQLITPTLGSIGTLSIVAFSAGCTVSLGLIDEHFVDFLEIDGKNFLIDSVHSHELKKLKTTTYLQNHVKNFECSSGADNQW